MKITQPGERLCGGRGSIIIYWSLNCASISIIFITVYICLYTSSD
jgi:hypothetical protein